ncbi:hypothetical protein HOK021_44830 [Streptomyces hygroscopicus]|nr:hypothetical protein HOK021_44830 [Streptomyces hygroscopicus]
MCAAPSGAGRQRLAGSGAGLLTGPQHGEQHGRDGGQFGLVRSPPDHGEPYVVGHARRMRRGARRELASDRKDRYTVRARAETAGAEDRWVLGSGGAGVRRRQRMTRW